MDTFHLSVLINNRFESISNYKSGRPNPKKDSPGGSGDVGPWRRRVGGTDAGGGAVGERRGGRGGAESAGRSSRCCCLISHANTISQF
jgi:hypothetical protein